MAGNQTKTRRGNEALIWNYAETTDYPLWLKLILKQLFISLLFKGCWILVFLLFVFVISSDELFGNSNNAQHNNVHLHFCFGKIDIVLVWMLDKVFEVWRPSSLKIVSVVKLFE